MHTIIMVTWFTRSFSFCKKKFIINLDIIIIKNYCKNKMERSTFKISNFLKLELILNFFY